MRRKQAGYLVNEVGVEPSLLSSYDLRTPISSLDNNYAIVHHIEMKARRKNSMSEMILMALEKTIDGYVRLEDFLYNTHIYARGYDRPLKKASIAQALKRLREQGLIERFPADDQILIKLTQTGKVFLDLETDKNTKWDSKWRIVIFDIPEEKRIIRNLFRRNLKRWGFKQLQKSVWISKRNIYEKLTAYTKELGIEKWVVIMESTKISETS